MTNGYTGTTVTFNGNVSGTGDFQRGNNKGGTQGYTFNGDVSGWTGKVQLASGADATNFTFGGKATEINASVVQKSGAALGLTITNNEAVAINGTIGADGGTGAINITTNGTGAKTFNSAVDATTLTVNAGSAVFKDSLTATGTVTVASGATLDLSGATSATAGTLDIAGGSTLVLGGDAMTLSDLTLTGVSGTSLLNIQGLGTDSTVIFTGLAAETNISNITFTDKVGKRVANASDYITGATGWLVYDETATTLSFATSLSPDLFWVTGTGTWDAAALWSKTAGGTADTTFTEEGNITFAGQSAVTVTLAEPATAGTVTVKDGDYTFAGGQLTVLNGLSVSNADATFQNAVDLQGAAVGVAADSSLTLGADTTMKSLSNEGTVDLGTNKLTLSTATTKGGTVTAGDVALTGANTFTQLNATGAVSGASALTVGDGSSMGSLAGGTALTTAGTVTIGADTSLASLANTGTLDLGANSLTLAVATTQGGTVNAKDVTLTGANTFTQLNATGAVTGADSLTVGGDSTIGSLADGTALTVTNGTTTINADTTLASLAGAGNLTTDGDLTLTNGGTIGGLTVNGGALTIGAPLAVTGTLTGVNTLEVTTLPSNAPALTVGDITTDGISFVTTEAQLSGLNLSIGSSWTLISGTGTPDVTFSTTGGNTLAFGEDKYVLSKLDDSVVIFRYRGGNEWTGASEAITWDGTDAGWSGGAPSATNAANLLGAGAPEITVVGEQAASKILVDAAAGATTDYVLYGDSVTTDSLELLSGGLTIANEVYATETSVAAASSLTIGEEGRLTTDTLAVEDPAALAIEKGGTLELTSGTVSNDILANNQGLVIMDSLTDGGTIGGGIQISKDSTYTGAYKEGTTVFATGGTQTLKADKNLTICGLSGVTFKLTGASHGTLGAIGTTGADVTFSGTNLNLASDSTMTGGTLTLTFSAVKALTNAGDKNGVDKAFTGAALHLNGVSIVLNQADGESGVSITPANNGQTEGVVLYTISSAAGSSFDESTTVTVNSDLLSKYFTNFRLEQGSINLVADRELSHYAHSIEAQTENGRTGLAMADKALALLTPQENPEKYADLAGVMDALDAYAAKGEQAAKDADRLAAALAGSSATVIGAAFAGDLDRQLRSIRNRTTSMGADTSVITEPARMPYMWFNVEGNYHRLNADKTAAGYKLGSWGGTIGADYNVSQNLTFGLALTAMYGDLAANGPESKATGDMDTYYVSFVARHATGAWVNTFMATIGMVDASLNRTVHSGNGSYTTDGSTTGIGFGLMYELAYTIPTSADNTTCIQPVFNIAFKHASTGSYTEHGSDAALKVGSQTMDSVTFGLGARLQTTVGETVFNRTSVLEMRALAKVEAGDRSSGTSVSFCSLPGYGGDIKGAKTDVFGVEFGAGLFIPVGVESGTLFFDVSAEFRKNAPNVTGTVGYRFTF